MAEFLTTADISARLQKIIREADRSLVLVSPYIRVNPNIKELIEEKAGSKTRVILIYGKKDLHPEERRWLDSLPDIGLYFRENLHAKCYISDKEAIITSMNLYQFSEHNNYEMGVVISKRSETTGDRRLYRSIDKEVSRILKMSVKEREAVSQESTGGLLGRLRDVVKDQLSGTANSAPTIEADAANEDFDDGTSQTEADLTASSQLFSAPAPTEPALGIQASGFCIRCKTNVDVDPGKPYCYSCYRTWSRYKDADYEEAYCHICGKYNTSTMRKPLCYACYQQYKDLFAVDALPL